MIIKELTRVMAWQIGKEIDKKIMKAITRKFKLKPRKTKFYYWEMWKNND
jgi:hypothetical protein